MLKLSIDTGIVKGSVNPGGSKSIANRALILRALGKASMPIFNVPQANDTMLLARLLKENPYEWNIEDAGTAARFSAAFLAIKDGEEHILTGEGRMLSRPMQPLLDVLVAMGAEITYLEQEGFLPVKIKGSKLRGGTFKLSHDVSSQFVSALAMIAPFCSSDVIMEFDSEPLSAPYIHMTLSMLSSFYLANSYNILPNGVHQITVNRGTPLFPEEYWVEPDWSSASYWYAAVALSAGGSLLLENYHTEGIQGDEILVDIFDALGVSSRFAEEGVYIKRTHAPETNEFEHDFSATPDLAPTFAVVLPLLGIKAHLTGLRTLRHKESDRVAALVENLKELGIHAQILADGDELLVEPYQGKPEKIPEIKTYGDHRMAMAFSVAVFKTGELFVDEEYVVKKSYEKYWDDFFRIIV